ncbi:MAG: phytoene/squalene synthase family protein [Bacteroidia bacterium]|jgi:phytoene/squalene synthetase
MKSTYDSLSATVSKKITRAYSTSFSLGIYFLNRKLHEPIYNIYGFVRLADEIVDSFHGYKQAELFEQFKQDLDYALREKISLNPVLQSFQETVHRYNIDRELIDTFMRSMEMDLLKTVHNEQSYQEYILGSAEVVGLMCLRVFTNGDDIEYNNLKPAAMKLGAAFQKVNFLRDLKQDYAHLGRTYFPGVDFNKFDLQQKKNIEAEIESDFDAALKGIKMLPRGARLGVFIAYVYYRSLNNKIKSHSPENIMNSRIRIPNMQKAGLLLQSVVRFNLNIL